MLSTTAQAEPPAGSATVAASSHARLPSESSSPWSFQIGALLIDWPEYDGADENETIAFPLLSLEYAGRYFVDVIDGIGVRLPTGGPVTFDVGFAFDPGRDENDSTRLAGLGDIDAGVAFKLKARAGHGAFAYSASVQRALSDDDAGYRVDLEAGYTRVLGGRLMLTPALIARYGSRDYAQQYYGVDEVQSARSSLGTHFPDAGFTRAGVQLTAAQRLWGDWTVQAQVKSERILGDAADGPVVLDDDALTIAFGVVHTVR